MKIPPGMTEAVVLAAIEKAVALLSPSFVFGYYDIDDIRQHGRLEALKVLEKESYDPSRPLENFLYTHVRNRYINLRRDKLRRNDPPCRRCHDGDPCGGAGVLCERYSGWLRRNMDKANIMRPLDLNHAADERDPRGRHRQGPDGEAEVAELVRRVRERLPADLQSTFLQMRDGAAVPKARRQVVEAAVKDILGGDLE